MCSAQKNIQVLEAKFAEKLLENGKGLKSDLNFWLRGLRDNDERLYSPVVSRIKSRVKASGSIDLAMAEIRKVTLSPRGVDILRTRLQGQQALRDSLEATANRLRANYVQSLETKRDAAEDGGKPNQVRAIQNEINACGESGKTFLNHLGSGILSAPTPAGEAP